MIVTIFTVLLVAGWLAEQHVRHARYADLRGRPTDDITIVHSYEIDETPKFRSREYVKIIRQDRIEP